MLRTSLGKRMVAGKLHARTTDGFTLPILDVTDPATVPRYSQHQIDRIIARTLIQFKRSGQMPLRIRKWMAKHSILLRRMMTSGESYLDGVTTYMCKLGPEAYGGGLDGWMNRKVLGAIGPLTIRMRLHAYVRLIADELIPMLEVLTGSPLHMVNIAGGVASDSWNVLLVIRRERPELLKGRQVRISVLDLETEGPAFGLNVIEALTGGGAPLHGLEISFEHIPYDWCETRTLDELLNKQFSAKTAQAKNAAPPIVTVSSEGGLFENGTDDEIHRHLKLLREKVSGESVVFGSFVKDAPVLRAMQAAGRLTFFIRSEEDISRLATESGWTIGGTRPGNPHYHMVSLKPR